MIHCKKEKVNLVHYGTKTVRTAHLVLFEWLHIQYFMYPTFMVYFI